MKIKITEDHIRVANREVWGELKTKSNHCPICQASVDLFGSKCGAGISELIHNGIYYKYSKELKIQVNNFDNEEEFLPGEYEIFEIPEKDLTVTKNLIA